MPDATKPAGGKFGAALRAVGRFIARHKKLFIFLTVVLIIAIIALSLLKSAPPNAAAGMSMPETTTLARQDLQQIVSGTGTLQTSAPREVSSSLSYEVAQLHVEEGDTVQAGQLLATLDTTDLDKDIEAMQKNVDEAAAKDALSRSQSQRKLQDAYDTRDINWSKNENAVAKAAEAIEDARKAAGNAALESKATAHATTESNIAMNTLNAAKTALSTAQTEYSMKEVAYQTVLGHQNLYTAATDDAAKQAILTSFGYADEAALSMALAAAKDGMDAAKPAVDAAQSAVDAAQAAYNSAYKDAYNTYKKSNRSVYTNAYNNADVSALETAYDNAVQTRDATYRSDTLSIQNAQDTLNTQKLQDSAASYRTQLEGLLDDKEACQITAPIGGTITAMAAEVGKSAGGAAMAGSGTSTASTALFTIENTGLMEITASIPEYDVVNVREGMQVQITTDALSDGEWTGRVSHISAKATDDSGNFTVVVEVVSDTQALAVGMSAKINIVTESRDGVFAVPYDAVATNEAGESVIYVMDQDFAPEDSSAPPRAMGRAIVVTTGMEADYYLEISSAELEEGMRILTDPEGINASEEEPGGAMMMGGMMGGGPP